MRGVESRIVGITTLAVVCRKRYKRHLSMKKMIQERIMLNHRMTGFQSGRIQASDFMENFNVLRYVIL